MSASKLNPAGKVLSVPWISDTRVLFYRTDILSQAGISSPPATLAQMHDDAVKLAARGSGKYGYYIPPWDAPLPVEFTWSMGVRWMRTECVARPVQGGAVRPTASGRAQRKHSFVTEIVLALLLPLIPLIALASPAALPSNFLKVRGHYLRDNAGTGTIVTLHGTNLGGWLTQEDWMSPLGEFALDRTGWTATASVSNATAGNALDGDDTTRWDTGVPQAGGEWFQVDMGTPTLLNRVDVDAAGFTANTPGGLAHVNPRC
jgi:hypothetical protein